MAEITRWDPFREIDMLKEEMDRLFDSFFGRRFVPRVEREWGFTPSVDVEETDDEFIVRAEVPGVEKDEIKITVTENTLNISGEKKRVKEEKTKTYHRTEIAWGKFSRSVTFPCEVNPEKAKATYKNGVLTVNVPKSEKIKPREIEIEIK